MPAGRPQKDWDKLLSKIVSCRVTERELAEIEMAAELARLSRANWLRWLVVKALKSTPGSGLRPREFDD
jgi:hypothetical protein